MGNVSSEGTYILKTICGSTCPCRQQDHFTHLNAVRNPVIRDEDASARLPKIKYINIRGREEHETVIKDADLCKEIGLDQLYESIVYFKRWNGWLSK